VRTAVQSGFAKPPYRGPQCYPNRLALRTIVGATLSAALLGCFVHSLVITPKKKPPQQRQRHQEWARMDLSGKGLHSPHPVIPAQECWGERPSTLSSHRGTRILDFANRVVRSRWVAVWTMVGLKTPLWFSFSPGF